MKQSKRGIVVAVLLSHALVFAACGGDESGTASADAGVGDSTAVSADAAPDTPGVNDASDANASDAADASDASASDAADASDAVSDAADASDAADTSDADRGDAQPTCTPTETVCTPPAGVPYCADLTNDPANCGACGSPCLRGQICRAMACETVLVTRAAVPVQGTCNLGFGHGKGVKVAVDPTTHAIYVAMRCIPPSGIGRIEVVRTDDGGATFGPRVYTGITSVDGVPIRNISAYSIATGGTDTIYLAAVVAPSTTGTLYFKRSTDGGATWGPTTTLDTAVDWIWGAHVSVRGDNVYVSAKTAAGIQLYTNTARGVGAFAPTTIAMNGNAQGNVLVDRATGDLWAASHDPNIRSRRSTDNGATFGVDYDVTAAARESGWALGGGKLFAARLDTLQEPKPMWVVPLSAPTTATQVTLSPSGNGYGGGAVAADTFGNAYIATGANVQIDRVLANGAAVADTRAVGVGAGPSYPHLAAVDGDIAVVAFQQGNTVYLSVQKY